MWGGGEGSIAEPHMCCYEVRCYVVTLPWNHRLQYFASDDTVGYEGLKTKKY